MKPAQQLLNAIQSLQVERLEGVVKTLVAQHEREKLTEARGNPDWKAETPLNDRLGGPIDATALHVVAKAFATYQGTPLGKTFNDMMAVLLKHGANPFLPMGRKIHIHYIERKRVIRIEEGQTVAELCGRNTPPALLEWLSQQDFFSNDNYPRTLSDVEAHREVAQMDVFRMKKQLREAQGTNDAEIAKRA
jgi:hypothetical protein